MNNVYEFAHVDELILIPNHSENGEFAVKPIGTFAGTIYKTLYRLNGKFVPSDTGDQLIADGLK
jgi:hypothetical protein